MYKFDRYHQFRLEEFNQPLGMKLDPNNRWVKMADTIPWNMIEDRYAKLFPSHTGMPAKPLRVALGSLLIQKKLHFADRELVEQITENPYLQYFIGLPAYTNVPPFVPSLMVEFRKRLTDDVLCEINELILEYNTADDDTDSHDDDDTHADSDSKTEPESKTEETENEGTLIIDATCAPQNICFPQDINLLNESRENLEKMIDLICATSLCAKPRTYRNNARRDYLNWARARKHSVKRTRKAIRQQLQYIQRDLKYIDAFLDEGKTLSEKHQNRLETIRKVYNQQKYMYDNHTHSVANRIVSLSQPYIRPIVRGKAKAPVEFGGKFDISIDETGAIRLEKLSFEAYNESEVLQDAVERYKERTGHYPERVLADKIYRTRENLAYCKRCGIRLSGPTLGRPKKDAQMDKAQKKQEYIDNADRVEVERAFSLAKRSYGLGIIKTKLEKTTRSSIALSILAMNVDRITAVSLCQILVSVFSKFKMCLTAQKHILFYRLAKPAG